MPIPSFESQVQPKETLDKASASTHLSLRRVLFSSLLAAIAVSGWLTAGWLYLGNSQDTQDTQATSQSMAQSETVAAYIPVTTEIDELDEEPQVEQVVVDETSLDSDNDGLLNTWEERFGTDPHDADSDFDSYLDGAEVANGYDPTGTGRPEAWVVIDKIAVNAPIVFASSREEEELQKNLQNGAIHYPGTVYPGMPGNSYITGHSSDYVWTPGEFKTVFTRLGELEPQDIVNIVYKLTNESEVVLDYQVYSVDVVPIDDPRLFQVEPTPVLTVVTSWPIGSTKERLMVKASLVN